MFRTVWVWMLFCRLRREVTRSEYLDYVAHRPMLTNLRERVRQVDELRKQFTRRVPLDRIDKFNELVGNFRFGLLERLAAFEEDNGEGVARLMR